MAEVFADTSGWANFFVRTEPFNEQAVAFLNRFQARGTRVVTTNYVLAELVALLTSPVHLPRPQSITVIETIRAASWVEVVHIDQMLDAEAFALLKARPDKTWSLADCASFALMTRRGISDALTGDHHFEQAGFVQLLK